MESLRKSIIEEVPVERRNRLWERVAAAVSAGPMAAHAGAAAVRPVGASARSMPIRGWRGALSTFARWSAPALVVGIAIGATGQAKLAQKRAARGDEPLGPQPAPLAVVVVPRPDALTAQSAPTPDPDVRSAAPMGAPLPPSSVPRAGSSRTLELARERVLLDRARASLSAGEPVRALELVEQHARRHAQGTLSEEREALAVNALVSLGRYREALRRGQSFRARYPNSLLMPSIDAALAAVPDP